MNRIVKVVKKNNLTNEDSCRQPQRNAKVSRAVADKISGNVSVWISELRERKQTEAVRGYNLYAEATR